jgi:uncharacterized protein YggE
MTRTLLMSFVLSVVVLSSTFAEEVRTISILGSAQLKVDPDSAEIDMAVTIVDMDVLKAKKQVDTSMSQLLQVAKKMQIAPEDVTATALHVTPQYDYNANNKLVGYETTRSLTLTLRDLAKLDQLLNACIEAGVNQINGIELHTSKEKELKAKALSLAIADAKERAAIIAGEFGVEIGIVQSITAGEGAIATNLSLVEGLSAESYQPGKIKVEADISVVFQLK